MGKPWSDSVAAYLTNTEICPRCDSVLEVVGRCSHCNADLANTIAMQVVDISSRAAALIVERQELIAALPNAVLTARPAVVSATALTTTSPRAQDRYDASVVSADGSTSAWPAPPSTAAAPSSSSQISVQSVLAVVGAALFAVAAIVFTFLNPDLTNFATRTAIVAVITVVFLAGAWLLSRASLRFSAEAVGALGMVFVILDIWAFSTKSPESLSSWDFGAIGTLVGSLIMLFVAYRVRLRTWLWSALFGLTVVPAMVGYSTGSAWGAILGHLGVFLFALGTPLLTRRLEARFDSRLVAERGTATVIQLVVLGTVLVELLLLSPDNVQQQVWSRAGALAALAVFAVLATHNQLPRFWSAIAGILIAGAVAILPFGLDLRLSATSWYLALLPVAASVVLVALALASRAMSGTGGVKTDHRVLLLGVWSVALAAAVPGLGLTLGTVSTGLVSEAERVDTTLEMAAILGIASVSVATAAFASLVRELSWGAAVSKVAFVTSVWIAGFALVAFAMWGAFAPATQVAIALGLAAIISIAVWRVPALKSAGLYLRLPLIATAHVLVVLGAVIAWLQPTLSVVGGFAVVVAIAVAAMSLPRAVHPLHTAAGYAYALVILGHALSLQHLETIAVLCITTAAASLFALAVTLIKRLNIGFWYAILGVTLVPFLIGIVQVLFQRSGWTALSTGVTFALALTLVLTRRPGLSKYLRAFAAALLVPALAVVVICLGAQLLVGSGSPVALPIIAVIVAAVLPSAPLIASALLRHGLPETDVRWTQRWIEVSSLVTGALAVLLALVRAAAGLDTTFIVLLIIGCGGIVTGITTRRVYAWVITGVSLTGALWAFWGIQHVTVLEPYILPPALAAAIIGFIAIIRKLPGIGLYSIGLVWAVVPSLVVLAATGNGGDGTTPWRAVALLAGAFLLLVAGLALGRDSERAVAQRLSVLTLPTLGVSALAAAAGAIQAVRFGVELDSAPFSSVMFPALECSLAGAIIAIGAGVLVATGAPRALALRPRLATARWLFIPSGIYLAIGPIFAVRDNWFSIWTLWALTALILGVMLVTVVRARTRAETLPPVWFLFALAWCTAVAGWSERELRVEAFSLLLGLALLAAGVIGMRAGSTPSEVGSRFTAWPLRSYGSWRLLTPGFIVLFLPSILATGTDPQTARAILVISLALVSILVGSLRKLAAPFILGIIVLPLENITVFAVQLGRHISATPWWITLATAGAVLLVIAVTYERRNTGEKGVAARLRDLG
ncbi:MAG TPA: hypothetical protein VGM94_09955 [Galbitalea sp.]|jgi:hypothetical protein